LEARKPGLSAMKALTTSMFTGSGLPTTAGKSKLHKEEIGIGGSTAD
jgi:hypothetical protein